jgi:hypothetical protein
LNAAKRAGMDYYVLKRLANHTIDDMTASYLNTDPEDLRVPAQRVADWLKEKCGMAEPGGNVARLR